jgi:hypothetical protein
MNALFVNHTIPCRLITFSRYKYNCWYLKNRVNRLLSNHLLTDLAAFLIRAFCSVEFWVDNLKFSHSLMHLFITDEYKKKSLRFLFSGGWTINPSLPLLRMKWRRRKGLIRVLPSTPSHHDDHADHFIEELQIEISNELHCIGQSGEVNCSVIY